MSKETVKERVWDALREMKKGHKIKIVELANDVEGSISYLSLLLRYAQECDFLKFHEDGNYVVKNIPKYEKFKKEVNELYNSNRKPRSSGPRSRKNPPKEFVVDETTVLNVIKKIMEENKELKAKLKKVMLYAKKIKEDRSKLVKDFERALGD